jgi:hypothetical protein
MDSKAFRIDFFVAIGALIISAVTAATVAYQTRVIGNQYAAAVWPYLDINATFGPHGETIVVGNDGLGPALVRSARLFVNEKPAKGWASYVHVLYLDPNLHRFFRKGVTLSMASVDASTTLRAGDTKSLFALTFPGEVSSQTMMAHPLEIDFCYCSLNDSCWLLHSTPGWGVASRTTTMSNCPGTASISSEFHAPARKPTSN